MRRCEEMLAVLGQLKEALHTLDKMATVGTFEVFVSILSLFLVIYTAVGVNRSATQTVIYFSDYRLPYYATDYRFLSPE